MPERRLEELLEDRRAAVEGIAGVIGTAVGSRAIHVYVTPGTDTDRVRPEAERALDGAPVEVIEMEMPEAHPD
jgi:hypothetical protein